MKNTNKIQTITESNKNQALRDVAYACERFERNYGSLAVLMEELKKAKEEGREPSLNAYTVDCLLDGHFALDLAQLGSKLSAYLAWMNADWMVSKHSLSNDGDKNETEI